MKVEIKLFLYLAPFFLLSTGIYAWFTTPTEWVGVVGLLLTGLFCLFIAGYIALTARTIDERPEDDLEGEISAVSGDYGHFAPYSWWPLWVGLSLSAVVLGLGLRGWWMVVIAAPFLVVAVCGWTFEFFRGEKAV